METGREGRALDCAYELTIEALIFPAEGCAFRAAGQVLFEVGAVGGRQATIEVVVKARVVFGEVSHNNQGVRGTVNQSESPYVVSYEVREIPSIARGEDEDD